MGNKQRVDAPLQVRPLLDELPVVGAVKASFMKAPTFSYNVVAYGVNPMFLPGLERWVNSFIKYTVLRPLVFPSVRKDPAREAGRR